VSEPSPRQVLYALVAGGFDIVVAVLVAGAAIAGLVPVCWTVVSSLAVVSVAAWSALNWRRTALVLISALGLFTAWAMGTLILAG
jgi:hypothetical protein